MLVGLCLTKLDISNLISPITLSIRALRGIGVRPEYYLDVVAMPVCSDDAVGGVFTVTLPLVGGEAPGLGPDGFRGWGLVEAAVLGCHLAALVGQLAHVRGVA